MKRIIPVIIIFIMVVGGYYGWVNQRSEAASPAGISGFGTIEAETIAISAELSGQIVAIHADEGDEVHQGQRLIELDRSMLEAQQKQLQAALNTAQAKLAEVSAPPRPEDVATAQAELQQAQTIRDGAYTVWQTAQAMVSNPLELNNRIDATQGQIAVLAQQVEAAQADLKKAEIKRDEAARNQSGDEAVTMSQGAAKQAAAAQGNLAATQAQLAGTQNQLDLLLGMRARPLTLMAQANAAKTTYQKAEAAVTLAQAKLAAAQAGPRTEEVAVAQAQVHQAAAALKRMAVQLTKLTITSPRHGIITERPVNPGELATPGSTLLTLADLDAVTLKVYIPETQIGQVHLGQVVRVSVDAYPDQAFSGQVSFIAPEAEFTPKNIQTQEERVNLVFAVKISLDNPQHSLKPGMPADAVLEEARGGGIEERKGGGLEERKSEEREEGKAGDTSEAQTSNPPTPQPSNLAEGTQSATFQHPNPLPPQPSPTPTLQPTNLPSTHAEILTWGLNVRSGPGVDYEVIGHLAKGTVVEVVERDPQSGWLRMQLPNADKTGWITGSPTYVLLTEGN